MEEYLNTLLGQIRCKKAKILVEQEIRSHLKDQIAHNKAQGLSEERAVSEAVKDMGDPVETGISLDRIHKPRISWSMIIVMAVISLTSIFIHVLIGFGGDGEVHRILSRDYICRSIIHVCLGFGIMVAVYFMDYTFMAKYAKIIAAVFLGFVYLISIIGVRGAAMKFFRIGGISISMYFFMLLFVPVYGALLYQYRGKRRGIPKVILWMLVTVWVSTQISCLSLSVILFFMMSVLLSIAVWKGWFVIDRKGFLAVFWSIILLLPVLGVIIGHKLVWFSGYYNKRLKMFLHLAPNNHDYIGNKIREINAASQLFGTSGRKVIGYLPEYNSSYILAFLRSNYGRAVALLVCGLIVFIIIKSFCISMRQKNQLGMIMGCSCGLVFLTTTGLNICENLNLLPGTQTFLPFFSYGGTGTVVCYILIGIILSIYRYKDLLPRNIPVRSKFKFQIKIVYNKDT